MSNLPVIGSFVFTQTTIQHQHKQTKLIMKKILLPVLAFSTIAGFAASAQAQITSSTTFYSDHSGSVGASCTVSVTHGQLENETGYVSSLTSPDTTAGRGVITTSCNSANSKMEVSSSLGTAPSSGSGALQEGLKTKYQLSGGTNAYASGGSATGVPTSSNFIAGETTTTINNLSNGYSSASSTLNVRAQVNAPPGGSLAAGGYTVKVKVTVTP